MPMGATNAHPGFVAMVCRFEKEWNKLYQKRYGNSNTSGQTPRSLIKFKEQGEPGSAVIVDDIILYAYADKQMLNYLECVLEILQFYRVTVKLRKTRFFPSRAEFVGVDVCAHGNEPAESKYEALTKLAPPQTFSVIRILIGFFGFYRLWLALFKTRVKPGQEQLKSQPKPGKCNPIEEMNKLKELWTNEDTKLLDQLKQEILDKPVLKRPNSNRQFYLKTDWSRWGMGAVTMNYSTADGRYDIVCNPTQHQHPTEVNK